MSASEQVHEVLVVGSGFAGLGQLLALRRAGITDVVLLEKADSLGGTWRDNTYPGCACDIPSHMYSLSSVPNPDWSRSYSPQPEIRAYLERVADEHDLRRHVHFGQEMTGATWDEERRTWTVHTRGGRAWTARFLVSALGALHLPKTPSLPGAASFAGPSFHSAQWDHDVDLRGKKVAVIGTGASAIQFVPQIADDAAEVQLYQRTPAWVLTKGDKPLSSRRRAFLARHPRAHRAYRAAVYAALESRAVGFNTNPAFLKPVEWLATQHIKASVKDPELVAKLTPDYSIGCKRILVSNDYYPTLARPDVDVITGGVREVRGSSIVDGDGVERDVDVIIYGTGFHVTDAFDGLQITGRGGRTLREVWAAGGMATHLGMTVTDFPNLFFLLGPNTGLGHNSVVFMIECQTRYVAQAISTVHASGMGGLDVRAEVQQRSNAAVQRRLDKGIWTRGGCTSWYLDAAGVNRTIWPGFTVRYWWETRQFDPTDFEFFGRATDASDTTEVPDAPAVTPPPVPVG
ncbi:cation diffusion facilitator CzcD-associated flavoprotein CzcO [Actinomycetospora succinea]|uniref:Cation diffusion facilitator CzcD-associated flavoprotein CzcO n=1 Tax=Actinomycetospora succinea TaxID=663603 RepID=A0A4R6VIY4_9PSEU|nr:NAD(P)/FAD-dependent oxidoreductase [Actinomycetospora succinea]TDQ63094.1 cation diffusion facilitator CzcD-associated flavoprotein CzcO [Actinomycetospora succinea]